MQASRAARKSRDGARLPRGADDPPRRVDGSPKGRTVHPKRRRISPKGRRTRRKEWEARPKGRKLRPSEWTFLSSVRKAADSRRTVRRVDRSFARSGRTLPVSGRTVRVSGRVFIDNLEGTAASVSKDAAVPEACCASSRMLSELIRSWSSRESQTLLQRPNRGARTGACPL